MSSGQALLCACTLLIALVQAADKTCPDANCNSTLSVLEEESEFASPCYSNDYPNDFSCKWSFRPYSTNNYTQITLHVFNLEAWYDYLKFDGPKNFIIFYNATNMQIIITGYPSGNISADFITDSGISYEGFNGSFSAVSENALLDQYTGYHAENFAEVLNSPMYLSSNDNTGSGGLNIMLMNIPNTTNSPSAAWEQYAELVGGSSGIHISDITATGFTVNWTKIDGVDSYTLEISLPNGTAIKPEEKFDHETTITKVNDLPSGSIFKLTLTAKNKLGSSETLHGNASTVTTVPVNMKATQILNDSFILQWDTIPGALEYRIEITKSGALVQSLQSNLSNKAVSGLQAGEQYQVTVNALFPVGAGNGATISVITAPEKVDPVVLNVTTTEVTLSWPSVEGAINYNISVMDAADKIIQTVAVSGLSKTVTGLRPGKTYTFSLTAENQNFIESQPETIKGKTKLIPESARVQLDTVTATNFTVSWPNINGAASYHLRITDADGKVTSAIPSVNAGYTFTGLSSGSRYNITLTALDGEGGSHDLTYDGVANTETKQVDGINITEQTQTQFKISWMLVPGATLYKINVTGEGILKNETRGESIVDGLQAGETYKVALHAVFPIGDGPVKEKIVRTVPADVMSLNVSGITTTAVVPTWAGAKGADSYRVVLKIGNVVESSQEATSRQSIDVKQPGTTYTLSVQAKNTAGSSTAAITTFTTRLGDPGNFQIVGITKNRFVLNWDKTAGATSYQYNCTGGDPKEVIEDTVSAQNSITVYTVSVNGLKPSTKYVCSVFAKTSDAQSSPATTTADTIKGFCNDDAKPTCLNGGTCLEIKETCECTPAYEGKSCETVKNWCKTKDCAPEYSFCINEPSVFAAVCKCNDGFKGNPEIRCQAFCEQDTVMTKEKVELHFNYSQNNEAVYSTNTCEDEKGTVRPMASAVCTVDIDKTGKITEKSFKKIVIVSCKLKIANVTIKIDEGSTNVPTEKLEEQSAQLQVLTSGSDKIAEDDVKKVADYMEDVAKIAETKSDAVTKDVLTSMVNTADNLINSKSIALAQTLPTVTTPASTGSTTKPPEETALQKEKEIKKKILKSLTQLAEQVIIPNNTKEIIIETPNMVVKVVEREANDTTSSSFAPAFLAEGSGEGNDTVFEQPLKITIPASAINTAKGEGNEIRISFFLHKDASLFPSTTTKPPEMIIAASLGKNVTATNLVEPIVFQYNNLENITGETNGSNRLRKIRTTPKCSYWNFDEGDWSGKGCCIDPDDINNCRCDHLTNFARVVSDKEIPADVVLETVCDVGLVLSMVGLVLTIIIHCLKEDIRKRRPTQILMHICANLLVSYIVFFVAMATPALAANLNRIGCIAVAAIMQFVFLATWCWMAVYAYDMYRSLVLVFNVSQSRYMTKCTLFGYGVPLLITLIDAAVSVGHFDANTKPLGVCDSEGGYDAVRKSIPIVSAYIADNMCWLHGYSLYFGFLLPVGIMLVFNMFVYSMVIKTLTQRGKTVQSSAKQTSAKDNLLISITLSASTGLTWIVAYLMLLSEDVTYLQVTSWIFAILNTVQGLVIFLTTCVRHENMRKLWLVPLLAQFSRFGSRIRMLSPKRDEFNIQAMSETGGSSYLSTNADNSTKATTAKSFSEKDMNSESNL